MSVPVETISPAARRPALRACARGAEGEERAAESVCAHPGRGGLTVAPERERAAREDVTQPFLLTTLQRQWCADDKGGVQTAVGDGVGQGEAPVGEVAVDHLEAHGDPGDRAQQRLGRGSSTGGAARRPSTSSGSMRGAAMPERASVVLPSGARRSVVS